ncbi:hypothetical protein C8J56DRAFT_880079 [Mycena floridula]|nr:hypothetical protein C8J56DRAFT_880079 [Mycena floridula]
MVIAPSESIKRAMHSWLLTLFFTRHAEEQRAATHKYYHKKRKHVSKEKQWEAAEATAPSFAAAPPAWTVPPHFLAAVTMSILPSSTTPPSVHSDHMPLSREERAFMHDLEAFAKRVEGWEVQWGGHLWNLIAKQVLTQSPEGDQDPRDNFAFKRHLLPQAPSMKHLLFPLRLTLCFNLQCEYEEQVADGQDLLRQMWQLVECCDKTPALKTMVRVTYHLGNGVGQLQAGDGL